MLIQMFDQINNRNRFHLIVPIPITILELSHVVFVYMNVALVDSLHGIFAVHFQLYHHVLKSSLFYARPNLQGRSMIRAKIEAKNEVCIFKICLNPIEKTPSEQKNLQKNLTGSVQ